MTSHRVRLTSAVAGAALLVALAPPAMAQTARGECDFDADGHPDLAIGIPNETKKGHRSGAVQVLYGTPQGPGARDELWHQDAPGVTGGNEQGDRFGEALACGDFDGDGVSDLAIGVPGEALGGAPGGAVQLLYGVAGTGLTAGRDRLLSQNTPGAAGVVERGDQFGSALVAGDFDGDGVDDLAVGVPGEGIAGRDGAGAVNVFTGRSGAPMDVTGPLWHQGAPGVKGGPEARDFFGTSLAAYDDGGGTDDLVVGVPGEAIGNDGGGAVHVFEGSANGITARDQMYSQRSPGIGGGVEDGDAFGQSLAVGDFDNDGEIDLAVGVPSEGISGVPDAGAVHVIYSEGGVLSGRDRLWHQGDRGILSSPETGEDFGATLTVGDFDADGIDDLAVGVVEEQRFGSTQAGAVHVLYGTGRGLSAARDQLVDQRTLAGGREESDFLGFSVTAADFDGDGAADLAIGVPNESLAGKRDGGMVSVVFASPGCCLTARDDVWHQNQGGIRGAIEDGDMFGTVVVASR
jgi:hypothetical protein